MEQRRPPNFDKVRQYMRPPAAATSGRTGEAWDGTMNYAAFLTSVKLTDTGCDVTVNIYQVGPDAIFVYATTDDYVTKLAGDWVPQNGQVSLVCDPNRIFVLHLAMAVSPDDHDAGSVSFAYTTGPFPSS